jgi:glycosyltransferase involved in cell wall biosynthesis
MSRKRISVCITHYNRPESLGATLESLANQTRQPDEIFLWDDCSPNDPTPIVEQWKDRLPNFTYHRNATNLGMPGNLNAVVSQATGDYVANLHDADIYHPELLEKWAAALDQYPEAGLVFCRDSRWDNPRFVRDWTPEPDACMDGREFFKRFYVGRIDSIIWGTVMVRRDLYGELLPFDPQYKNWADVDMWMRICGKAAIAFVPEKLLELDANPTHGGGFSFEKMRRIQGMVINNI